MYRLMTLDLNRYVYDTIQTNVQTNVHSNDLRFEQICVLYHTD